MNAAPLALKQLLDSVLRAIWFALEERQKNNPSPSSSPFGVEGLLEPLSFDTDILPHRSPREQAVHRRRAAELLIDVQRHHGMNFPNRVFLCFSSSV